MKVRRDSFKSFYKIFKKLELTLNKLKHLILCRSTPLNVHDSPSSFRRLFGEDKGCGILEKIWISKLLYFEKKMVFEFRNHNLLFGGGSSLSSSFRVTARKSWRNVKWKQLATTGSNKFWRTSINFINLNFKFNFWLLDHQCMIFIDPLMETQWFKFTNASTEIIGPIVRYSWPDLV